MPAPISIIIPTYNAAHQITPLLAALTQGIHHGLICEVIFADGGSNDDIAHLADETGANLIKAPKGRGSQLAAGANAARGEWLLFLHADTQFSTDWIAAVSAHLHSDKAGYFRLAFDASGCGAQFVATWANFRARWFGLPYGDQGLLIRASYYAAVDGFDPIPLMEDVAMAKKLRGQLVMLGATAITGAERYQTEGWFWRGAKNLWILTRYLLGASPKALAKAYRPKR